MGAEKRFTELANPIWETIRGDSGAVEILKGAAEEKPDDVQALHNYLSSLWTQPPEFAENVRDELASSYESMSSLPWLGNYHETYSRRHPIGQMKYIEN